MKTLLLMLSSILLISSCAENDSGQTTNALPISQAANPGTSKLLQSGEIKRTEDQNRMAFQGIVDVPPNQHARIHPYFEGYITEIEILEGSEVTKGDLLFKLTNPDFIQIQKDYLNYQAQVDYLKQDMDRKKTLNKEQIASDLQLQKIEMDYRMAKANLASTVKTLKLMNIAPESVKESQLYESINIYAPISGYVTSLVVKTGEYIGKGKEVASIVNTEHLHLELKVFEKELIQLFEGQLINYRIPELSNEVYEAELYLIGKSIDPKTRMVTIHAHPKNDLKLLPGMFIEAFIERPN
jgi:cobalt-zinc-cadmium efflux system membrane fusion protein